MIDKSRRESLAYHLRQLSIGRISNDAFETRILNEVSFGWLPEQYCRSKEAKSDDAIFVPMLSNCWSLYSDLNRHKLNGRNALKPEALKTIVRWILFLQSDLEYEWSDTAFSPLVRLSVWDYVSHILSIGYYRSPKMVESQREAEEMNTAFQENYWPFLNKDQFELQRSKPKFLTGKIAKNIK